MPSTLTPIPATPATPGGHALLAALRRQFAAGRPLHFTHWYSVGECPTGRGERFAVGYWTLEGSFRTGLVLLSAETGKFSNLY